MPFSGNDFLLNFVDLDLHSPRRQRLNCWSLPPDGVLKFNVDGSGHGTPGKSGIVGVLRNSMRQTISVFSKGTGLLWAFEAEVKAILHALIFCKQFQLKHTLIESDSSFAVG